ncbi:ferredoxin, partial [Odoribacter splanchnicus]|nr:ferredoxin [Odoribacter splanchnicus]
ASLELREGCVAQGVVPVAGGAFSAEHSYSRPDRPKAGGRPDNPDLQKARRFGEQLGRLLNRFQTFDEVAPNVV